MLSSTPIYHIGIFLCFSFIHLSCKSETKETPITSSESHLMIDSVKNVEDTPTSTKESIDTAVVQKNKVDSITIKKDNRRYPILDFEFYTLDFGEIIEGDIIEKSFPFTNNGNAPLQIKSTSATCGCTRPSFPFIDILPGESHQITVRYNSVGKVGKQKAEITVISNAEQKITKLYLAGIVDAKNSEIDTLK